MHEHGPNYLEGPIRGSHAWWRGLGADADPADTPATATRKKKSVKTEEPGIREELVERIRREIEAGTYDTPEKWQTALDCLLDRLD